jgi:hypothetical protein
MIVRRRVLSLAFAIPFFVACASSAPPPDSPGPRGGPRIGGGGDLSPLSLPASWWHDIHLADPLHLTGEQVARLDALATQQADVAGMERDSMVALRELRSSLDASDATAAGIVAAGDHLRELRKTLLEQQIALLAAQREILTIDQWNLLQRELVEERRPSRGEGMGGRGRGRGPGGGRGGRRPSGW